MLRKEVWVRVNVEEGAGRKTLGVEVPNMEFWKTGSARGVVASADAERLSVFFSGREKYWEKYPFGLQKLEAPGFRFHRVEVIYTEKMITLSNVSLEGWPGRKLRTGERAAELWSGPGGESPVRWEKGSAKVVRRPCLVQVRWVFLLSE